MVCRHNTMLSYYKLLPKHISHYLFYIALSANKFHDNTQAEGGHSEKIGENIKNFFNERKKNKGN